MSPYRILVMNGPNLGHLGQRQPEIYGHESMESLPKILAGFMGDAVRQVELEYYQDNSEGKLIDRLELARTEGMHGIVLNAGAYTHTSLALADSLAWIGIPCVEVHLSNVWARPEKIRHRSHIARQVIGVIAGFGMTSYALAVMALIRHLDSQE